MGNKGKKQGDRSTGTYNLGLLRKQKIKDFKARRQLKGMPVNSIEDAVNILIDSGLEHEALNQ